MKTVLTPPIWCVVTLALSAGVVSGCAAKQQTGYGFGLEGTPPEWTASPAAHLSPSHNADLWERIRQGRGLAIPPDTRVTQAIERFKRHPDYMNGLAQRARPYLHVIVDELEREGLPTELALLPEIESRYNPRAVSPMRAAGMWQFMPYTGKQVGLEQTRTYDGRYDILASTRGALTYLKQLHQEFGGDWALALASYNAGPGRVRAAQRANRALGQPTDYWSLNLPAETQTYVPRLLALMALVQAPRQHGVALPSIANRPALDVVEMRQPVDLATVATACGLSLQILRDLNPAWKSGTTPTSGTRLLVPVGYGQRLHRYLTRPASKPTVAGRANAHVANS